MSQRAIERLPITALDIDLIHELTIERYTLGLCGRALGSAEMYGTLEDGYKWRVSGCDQIFEDSTEAAMWMLKRNATASGSARPNDK